MRKSTLNTGILILITVAALFVFATTLSHALVASPSEPEVPMTLQESVRLADESSSLPVRLAIPSLGVDAHVQQVGISRRGTMAVPTNYTDVGWYRYGTIPGHIGSAVMAGHVDNGFGLAGVFNKLGELKTGDEVIVTDARGTRLYFKVIDSRTFTLDNTDTSPIFNDASSAKLNLITCEGEWDAQKKMYSERRVVFAELSRTQALR